MKDKRLSLDQAVRDLIEDGDCVVLGACLEPAIPFAVTREIIRQGKRDLDIVAPISDASTDMLVGAGCVARVTGAWVGNVSGGLGHNYRRAVEQGIPHRVAVSQSHDRQISRVYFDYRDVRLLIGADDFAQKFASISQLYLNLIGTFHDVEVCADESIRSDDKAGALALHRLRQVTFAT